MVVPQQISSNDLRKWFSWLSFAKHIVVEFKLINLWQTADKLVINSTCMLCTDIFGVTNIRQSPEWFMRWRSAKNTNLSKSATAEPNMLKIFIQNIIKHFSHPFPFSASQSGRKTWSFQNWIIIPCRWRWGAENCCRIRIILMEEKPTLRWTMRTAL